MSARSRALAAFLIAASVVGCKEPSGAVLPEVTKREAFRDAVVRDAGASRALMMSSSSDVLFQEGFGPLEYDPKDDWTGIAFRWMGQNAHARVRSQGDHAMHLEIGGWVHRKVTLTRPIVSAFVNGVLIADSGVANEEGFYLLVGTVPAELLRGKAWVDLVVTVSSVAYHWADAPDLHVVHSNHFVWKPEP